DTVIISLNEDEENILARMKSKTRYNIRLSFRKGVVVQRTGAEVLDEWYRLYEETALRDKITIHSKAYYRKIFELSEGESESEEKPEIILFNAVYNDQILAGIIVARYGSRATYLYGASSNEHRNLMPAYALQWEAIKYAKEKGCTEYDLFGIPPENDPDHPMSGLYRFKTGFGGDILHRPGCWDLPLKPVVYRVYRWAESLRLFYYKKIRKR
ncbi:MAG: peptidoglycan bridge formation glycyltransferase FemA/FemB family protein, partial [Spirochaetales bacterium]|nr:peptidoglycan bridge formation glycyltransferase FemA/FemB family protein [Spirochaetales bacterium]